MKQEFIQIYWTCGDLREAREISSYLVEKHLVACANIFPQVESLFLWKGKVESTSEVVVLFKTVKEKFEEVKEEIQKRGSYELPAILQLPIVEGNREYLDWIVSSLA